MDFYKSNHPDVMAAVEIARAQHAEMAAVSKAFAAEMGGNPYFLGSITGKHFGGLTFSPSRDKTLWTLPDNNGGQRPRAKPRAGATEEQKAEHKALTAKWAAMKPTGTVKSDGIYAAIGTDWGALLFSGIGYFTKGGFFYVQTKVKLNDRMTEILGSEYHAASEAEA